MDEYEDDLPLSRYIKEELRHRKITPPEVIVTPILPKDITIMEPNELTKKMAEYTAYMGYVSSEAASVGTALIVHQAKWNNERQEKYKELHDKKKSGEKITDKAIEAALDTDKELDGLLRRKYMSQELKNHLDVIYKDSERRLNLLSRELSRRISSQEKGSL